MNLMNALYVGWLYLIFYSYGANVEEMSCKNIEIALDLCCGTLVSNISEHVSVQYFGARSNT